MHIKITSILLVVLLASMAYPARAFAGQNLQKEAEFTQKVKRQIMKFGRGPEARVEVKLKDKRKLKGYISEVGDESFVVVSYQTGSSTTVMYPEVKQVGGENRLNGRKIAIGIAIGAGILGLLALLAPRIAE